MSKKVFVCERCQTRVLRNFPNEKIEMKWSLEKLKELKKEFFAKHEKKSEKRVVLTSCLGLCPEKAIAYQDASEGLLDEEKSYSCEYSEDQIKTLFF